MARTLGSTPAADGYRMPAEWAHHSGCWLVWPERPDNWRLGGKPAQAAFTAVATAIAATEPVTVAVSARQYDNARSELPAHVRVVEMTN
ncbi:MAG: agmatine deiminase, partial [Cellulomonadaceae bacterium]|nr:agmatine deiminase [Cellulomonadaceae bacterium]